MTYITEVINTDFYHNESFHLPISFANMVPAKTDLLKDCGKQIISLLKDIEYIENNYTGKVEIELNLSQGGLGDLKIKRETRIST